ncbi:hypothetical protein HK104_000283 [Borealophlyctis nickersoniae]|nr:hypothetical protein HK104_000283 [Borealophlyctis nickersoniae]
MPQDSSTALYHNPRQGNRHGNRHMRRKSTWGANIYPDNARDMKPLGLCRVLIWEWLAAVALGVAGAALELVQPYERVAFGSDLNIAYPLVSETVPSWLLAILAAGVPLVIIVLVSAFARGVPKIYDMHTSLLGLLTALAFTLLFTQIVKVAVGSLRPNFLARCVPVLDPNDPILHRVLRCTGDPAIIKEGRKSFFSGHSSLGFAGLGYLSLYFSRHLNFSRPPIGIKYIICLLPLILATLIAISRVDNYWHRWQDVFVGAIVGMGVAILSYRYHHPPSAPGALDVTDDLVGEGDDSRIDESETPIGNGVGAEGQRNPETWIDMAQPGAQQPPAVPNRHPVA